MIDVIVLRGKWSLAAHLLDAQKALWREAKIFKLSNESTRLRTCVLSSGWKQPFSPSQALQPFSALTVV
jgi:hypothetical protein